MARRSWLAAFVVLSVIVGLGLLYSRSVIYQPEEDFEILAAQTERQLEEQSERQTGSATASAAAETPSSSADSSTERNRLQNLIDQESANISSLNRDLQDLQARKIQQQAIWEVEFPAQIQTANSEIQKLTDEQSRLTFSEGGAQQESEASFNQRTRALEAEKNQVNLRIRDQESALQKTQQQITQLPERISDLVERDRALVTLREQETSQRRGIEELRNQIQDLESQTRTLKRNVENDLVDRNSRIRGRHNDLSAQIEELRNRVQSLRREQDQVRLSLFSLEDQIRQTLLELRRRQSALQESERRLSSLTQDQETSGESPSISR